MSTPGSFPKRPPRIELFSKVRPFYFLTFNTRDRKPVLANEDTFDAFLAFFRRARDEHSVAVGRFVLMPDHVHLFVSLPEDVRLAAWVKALKSVLGKTLLVAGVPKPRWQKGFFDHVLRSSESYSAKWDYVRNNPVRAGLVASSEKWPWQGEIVRIEM